MFNSAISANRPKGLYSINSVLRGKTSPLSKKPVDSPSDVVARPVDKSHISFPVKSLRDLSGPIQKAVAQLNDKPSPPTAEKQSPYSPPVGTTGPLLADEMNTGFALNLPSKPTRESVDETLQRLGNADPFVAKLTSEVDSCLPKLKEAVGILSGGCLRGGEGEILKQSVCGMASRVLGFQLRQKGYEVEQVESHHLDRNLTSQEHTYLRVKDPAGQEIVVDPTYFQFTNVYGLSRDAMPKTEVMIARKEQLGEAAGSMVKLREKKLDEVQDREHFLNTAGKRNDFLSGPETMLTERFKSIWTDSSYRTKGREDLLEHDLMKFQNDPSRVSPRTTALIQSGLLQR